MSAGEWGYVFGSGLTMFVFFLIFIRLLALIPSLRQSLELRNVLAWLTGALTVGFFSRSSGASIALLVVASIVSAVLAGLRYWYVARK